MNSQNLEKLRSAMKRDCDDAVLLTRVGEVIPPNLRARIASNATQISDALANDDSKEARETKSLMADLRKRYATSETTQRDTRAIGPCDRRGGDRETRG